MHTICKHGYIFAGFKQKSPYLMTSFNLLQNFVVTNLLHVMKLLDLNRTQNHNKLFHLTDYCNVLTLE